MRPSTLLASGVASLLALSPLPSHAGTEDHFILTRLSTLGLFRYDPIVNPGKVSAHVHNILGASCFDNVLNTPEEQQACDCSTAIVGDDRSNYWSPTLYYQFKNGSLSPMLGSNRIYYFLKSKDVKPFPPGLRMITGSPTYKNVSDYKSLGVRLSCNTAYEEGKQGAFLPNKTSHPEGCSGVILGVYYPSCGLADGSLDSPDHFSHMAWPIKHPGGGAPPIIDVNGWECPESHPIKYPTIFQQASYYPTSKEMPWDSPNPVVLSNGDQSGNTYHADFFNGWKASTLQATLDKCGIGHGPGEHLEECAPLAKTLDEVKTWGCRYQNQIPNEDVGLYRPIKKLPGCNPLWPTDGPAAKPQCKEKDPPGTVHPNTEFENLVYRMHLPLLFTLANDTNNATEMKKYIPGLGTKGSSKVRPFGKGALNEDSLTLSTVEEILAVPGQPMQGVLVQSGGTSNGTSGTTTVRPTSAAHSASVASKSPTAKSKASAKVTTSAIANAGVLLPEGGSISTSLPDPTASVHPTSHASRVSSASAASHGPTLPASEEATAEVTASTSADDAEATTPAKASSKVCKPKKRPPVATCDNHSFKVREHLYRRSRHRHHGH